MTPRMALKRDWKTARIEPRVAVMAWKMEEKRLPRDSTREGMIAIIWFVSVTGSLWDCFEEPGNDKRC